MFNKVVTIACAEGLHARPAALFVAAAKEAGVPVKITFGDKKPVPANSILSVLSLGARKGDVITLSSDSDDGEAAIAALAAVLEREDL